MPHVARSDERSEERSVSDSESTGALSAVSERQGESCRVSVVVYSYFIEDKDKMTMYVSI